MTVRPASPAHPGLLVAAAVICMALLPGCESRQPATRAGAAIDRAGTETGEVVGRAATATGDAVERAGGWVRRRTE
ncbi:hypothetical protein [Siccirubricoccus phaeus]|uniref:hypothetical protein n=1 Tax=Siccirubricoccus phaeus TaxID=2595053 RepID=UPI0011F35444|nr:hypothetical protein [Siccirubricoccus phaeus]